MKYDSKTVFGISFLFLAFVLIKAPVYTSLKKLIMENGGSIWAAILISWMAIGITFLGGLILLKRSTLVEEQLS